MRTNKFFKTTLILLVGGLITKILGFIIKILYTRAIGTEGVSLYTLITPTYSLMLAISSLGMPLAISKMVAEKKVRSYKILSQAGIILLFINIFLIFLTFSFSDLISRNLLHDARVSILLKGASLTLPFVSVTSVLKGYFYGKQQMIPNNFSNVIEQLIRIVFIIVFLPYFLQKGLVRGILSLILISIITETISFVIYMTFLDKGVCIDLKKIKYERIVFKDLLSISIPSVAGRFIGNIGFFFEPIILSYLMVHTGFTEETFVLEYGIYNGYAMSYLLLPSFFISAIATSLVPEISKFYSNGNKKMVKRRLNQGLFISFLFGGLVTIFMVLFCKDLMELIYNTNVGYKYVETMGLFFILYYLEAPLTSALQSIGKSNITFKISFLGVFLKLLTMSLLAFLGLGMYSLLISEIINIIFVVFLDFKYINKFIYKKRLVNSN